jgi:hypothetical protein
MPSGSPATLGCGNERKRVLRVPRCPERPKRERAPIPIWEDTKSEPSPRTTKTFHVVRYTPLSTSFPSYASLAFYSVLLDHLGSLLLCVT